MASVLVNFTGTRTGGNEKKYSDWDWKENTSINTDNCKECERKLHECERQGWLYNYSSSSVPCRLYLC